MTAPKLTRAQALHGSVREILRELMLPPHSPDELSEDMALLAHMDSLDRIEFGACVEEVFCVTIADAEISGWLTMRDVLNTLTRLDRVAGDR